MRYLMPRRVLGSYLFGALTLAVVSSLHAQRVPGETWQQYATPEEAGWTPDGIELAKAFADSIGTAAFMLVYDGAVVTTYGDVARRYMCHSVRKSLLSGLYGIHVGEGTIDVNKTLTELGIDDKDPLTDEEKQASILDMLKARSGVYHPAAYETASMAAARPPRGSHPHNTFWYYNNWDFNTLNAIFEQETGSKIFEEFKLRFADPLQMDDFRVRDGYYHLEAHNSDFPAYPFRLSARDMARFGLLYLNEGRWGDEQVIPASWVEATRTSYSDAGGRGYGYMWWTFPESFADGGVYSALGVGSQTITVVPAHDIVFIHRVDTYVGDRVSLTNITGLLQRLIEARTGDAEDEPLFVPLPDPPPAARFTEVDEETLAKYADSYLMVNVMLEDGTLVLYDPSGGSFGMLPITEREFLLEDIQDRVYFRSTEEGEYQLILESMQDRRARAQIRSGNVQRAIEILVQSVEYFPDSWKAYDSLAGAYEHAGDAIHAIENFRKSLELNPRNTNAAEAIERLGGNSP